MTNLTPEQAEDSIVNLLMNNTATESLSQQIETNYIRRIIRTFDLHKLYLELDSRVSTQLAIFIIIAKVRSQIFLEYINQYSRYLSCCLLYNFLLYSLDNILCFAMCLEINCSFKHKLKLELDFTRSYRHALCLQENLEFAYQYSRGSQFEKTILELKKKLFGEEVINSWWIQKGQAWSEELISITIMVRDYYRFQARQISNYKQQLDLVALQGRQIIK